MPAKYEAQKLKELAKMNPETQWVLKVDSKNSPMKPTLKPPAMKPPTMPEIGAKRLVPVTKNKKLKTPNNDARNRSQAGASYEEAQKSEQLGNDASSSNRSGRAEANYEAQKPE